MLLLFTLFSLFSMGGAHAASCSGDKEMQSGLCYEKPRDGFSCTATSCSQNCPDGYKSSGVATCTFAGERTKSMKEFAKKHDSTPQKCLALWYRDCDKGYSMNSSHCGTCSFDGKWDITRGTYTRNAGTVPPGVVHAMAKVGAELKDAYDYAKDQANKYFHEAEKKVFAIWLEQDKQFAKDLSKGLTKIKSDTQAVESLKRLKQIAKVGNVSDPAQMKKDLQFLRTLIASAQPPKWPVSTFGVGFTGSAGFGSGATLGTVFSVDTNGKMGVALCTATTIGIKVGEDASVQVSWAPGDVKSNVGGGFVGASIGIEGDVGVELEISVSTDYIADIVKSAALKGQVPIGVLPSIAVGPAAGDSVSLSLTEGSCLPVWYEQ